MIDRSKMLTFNVASFLWFAAPAQTEGDTGYDYNDAYDENYEDDTAIGMDPLFDVPIVNVTVVKGQTAVLPCSIEYLGKFKVAWLDHNSIPLTYEERRVVDDTRFSVVRPYVKEWNLQIRDIRWEDEGQYRCTINTNPVKSKLVMLHVKVPAEIIDEFSSGDVTVEEGDVITLTCNVTGVPLPYVDWKRKSTSNKAMSVRDHRNCKLKTSGPGSGAAGATLLIQNVSRYCDDIYECTANNGVPPPVSRQMKLTVEFAPHISMPNRRIRQMKGRETILECAITAFPHAVNYWEKDTKRITSSMKHRIEAYDEGDHTLTLSLRIHITDPSDFGEYKCVASNRLGKDEGSMYLFDYSDMESKHPPSQQLPEAGLDHSKQVVRPTDSIFPPTFQSNGNRHLTNHVGQQQPQQQQPDQQQPTHRRGYTQLEVTQVYRWTDKSSKKYEPFNERIIGGCYGYVAISNWLFLIVSSFHVIL